MVSTDRVTMKSHHQRVIAVIVITQKGGIGNVIGKCVVYSWLELSRERESMCQVKVLSI